jgi:tight adherence protein B
MLSAVLLGVAAAAVAWLVAPASATRQTWIAEPVPASASSRLPVVWAGMVSAAFGLVLALGPTRAVPGVAAIVLPGTAAVAFVVRRLLTQVRGRRRRDARRRQVLEFCDALTAELQAGLPAPIALERACAAWPEMAPVASASRLDGDVPSTLRAVARLPGSAGLTAVAAAWDVAERSGAGLAVVVERVTESVRHDADAAAEVASALGPPRATARMLVALPVLGVGLGMSMGANPLDFLLTTTPGLGCLFLGLMLALLGLVWVERLAAAAER